MSSSPPPESCIRFVLRPFSTQIFIVATEETALSLGVPLSALPSGGERWGGGGGEGSPTHRTGGAGGAIVTCDFTSPHPEVASVHIHFTKYPWGLTVLDLPRLGSFCRITPGPQCPRLSCCLLGRVRLTPGCRVPNSHPEAQGLHVVIMQKCHLRLYPKPHTQTFMAASL